MKTKLVLTVIFSAIFMHCAYSQTSEKDNLDRLVGIDATFINNFIPLENRIGSTNTHLIHFIKHRKDNIYRKQAFNIGMFGGFDDNDDSFNLEDSFFDIDYKIGKVKRKEFFKNAYLLVGVEFLSNYTMIRRKVTEIIGTDTKVTSTNFDQVLSLGAGPVIGLGYNFNNRLSIYTEAGFYLRAAYSNKKFKSEENPNFDFIDQRLSYTTSFALPSSIILFFHF